MDLKLIEKFFEGECTPAEYEEVLQWFKNNDLTMEQDVLLSIWWQRYNQESSFDLSGDQRLLHQIHRKIIPSPVIDRVFRTLRPWIRVAAVVLFTILIAILIRYYYPNREEPSHNIQLVVKENPRGTKSTIMLPDSTKVYLNCESRIEYPEIFGSGERVIYLEGEAFFEVTENPIKPLKVRTGDLEITTLGTSFNINAYKDNPEIKVSLVSGSVQVADLSSMNPAIILQPGEEAIWSPEEKEIRKQSFDNKSSIGWVNGQLRFDDVNLEEFIKILERWFGVTIQIEGTDKAFRKEWRLCGEFNNTLEDNYTLEDVLEAVSFLEGFSFEINRETKEVKLIFEN